MPYLIDGNNLLGSWGGRPTGDAGRAEVVRRVAAFCRRHGARATIVFDGAPLRSDQPVQELGRVGIRTPPPGGDADGVIRDIVAQAARPGEIVVVTSDKPLYSFVRSRGATCLRAHEWNALDRKGAASQPGPSGGEKPEREDDIEGWLARFGAGEDESGGKG